MWFIFLVACIAVALAALLVIWIGSKVFRSIERDELWDDMRNEEKDGEKENKTDENE